MARAPSVARTGDTRRWRIGRRMVFVTAFTVAASAFASTYWWLTWWTAALPDGAALLTLVGVTTAFGIVGAVFARVVVRGIVSPLQAVTEALRGVDYESLGDPMAADAFEILDDDPFEVVRLKRAFAHALERIRRDRVQRQTILGGLVHDLKTPVVAQRHLLARLPEVEGALRAEIMTRALSNADDIAGRLDRVIDVLRVDSASLVGARSSVDLAPTVAAVLHRSAGLVPAHVTVAVGGQGAAVVDVRAFERALENVLVNALRHARSEVHIEVRAGLVSVEDDGAGFAIPFADAVDPFRPGPPVEGRIGTAGLGLYVARRSLEGFGGRLVLEASRPGRTKLLLYLPVAP